MKQLQVLRERAGLTQEELGERVGLTQGYISHLETGRKRNPDLMICKTIVEVLRASGVECSIDSLLEDTASNAA